MSLFPQVANVLAVGIGATALMDAWAVALGQIGVPPPNFALVGRWVGYMRRGRFVHSPIARSAPLPGEGALGWIVHYAVGIVFASVLVAVEGVTWMREPTLLPALALGVLTVAAPLLVMQPAIGAGFAASKTAAPAASVLRSLGNHAVFGAGLYLTALLVVRMLG